MQKEIYCSLADVPTYVINTAIVSAQEQFYVWFSSTKIPSLCLMSTGRAREINKAINDGNNFQNNFEHLA